ncbi:MAG TPA: TylF/MycF/NovP-related O-methyltransferase [Solimonas sp.]|nr:TylF/MycF/NovP-related O-methyltransferase [Solimonas sp.]
MSAVRELLQRLGLHGLDRRIKRSLGIRKHGVIHPPYGPEAQRGIDAVDDVARYGAIALAVARLQKEGIEGEFAEVGVYKGELSQFLASIAPERRLHLFDTFSGFAETDAESRQEALGDTRFRDTSVEGVRQRLGSLAARVSFHAGWFPDTATELGEERFAFVMLDLDKYKPTLAGLQLFYPRLVRGGYLFLHDYNSPESNHGVSRALHEFLADKPELPVELPDRCGSVVLRKL